MEGQERCPGTQLRMRKRDVGRPRNRENQPHISRDKAPTAAEGSGSAGTKRIPVWTRNPGECVGKRRTSRRQIGDLWLNWSKNKSGSGQLLRTAVRMSRNEFYCRRCQSAQVEGDVWTEPQNSWARTGPSAPNARTGAALRIATHHKLGTGIEAPQALLFPKRSRGRQHKWRAPALRQVKHTGDGTGPRH